MRLIPTPTNEPVPKRHPTGFVRFEMGRKSRFIHCFDMECIQNLTPFGTQDFEPNAANNGFSKIDKKTSEPPASSRHAMNFLRCQIAVKMAESFMKTEAGNIPSELIILCAAARGSANALHWVKNLFVEHWNTTIFERTPRHSIPWVLGDLRRPLGVIEM
jgi:hypothetical protein